jgi:hypothetical protein
MKVTHLRVIGNNLFHKDKLVETKTLLEGLTAFIEWLESLPEQKQILVGHNIKSFDCRYLLRDLLSSQCLDRFSHVVAGFVDTLPFF